MTQITSNGSKWAGESPDSIEKLIEVLGEYPLDRVFATRRFGCFIHKERGTGIVAFRGNFRTLSHVFNIRTDDPQTIAALTRAIRKNMRRVDYLSQPDPNKVAS